MQDFYEITSAATEEQRQNLAELTGSGFGSAPDTLCNHIRYLRFGSIGQIFCYTSWKQVVTDVADQVAISWSEVLGDRTWHDLSTQEIEDAVVVKQFQHLLEQLRPEQRQHLLMDLTRESDDPHLEGFLLGGGAMLAARMSGFGVYVLASTVLGSLTGALGITLPFAVYMGVSQTLALVLGPVGWAALAGGVLFSLNQPNWNRLVLSVLHIATLRHSATPSGATAEQQYSKAGSIAVG
ncbi:hypothetical protein C1752_01708 [Acaryochloris thomasi RCC1774]|uniref:Uncharacterized protein n=1 Tax=Acaryochloris thomasi RCC1774 TaxID=1764569 RepID=A0A2W1JKF5_9CYAN|nr:hypothetical protein [Acaryochloris thomasi]PZD73890.1 hypothetical protein C1752_01708 [Acaryochloris thomasi RCC1774]